MNQEEFIEDLMQEIKETRKSAVRFACLAGLAVGILAGILFFYGW